jgi:hypothetical protein
MSRILGNPKVHYSVHNSQPLFPNLSHINPVHTPPPYYFLQIPLNIILPSMSKFSQPSLSFRFPHQNPICTSPLPTRPTYKPWARGLHLNYETALDIHFDNIITKNLKLNCSCNAYPLHLHMDPSFGQCWGKGYVL